MIDAIIISCGEPQLPKCLEAVHNQDIPFTNVFHIASVTPEAEAYKRGVEYLTSEWGMFIGGDMTLFKTATVMALQKIVELHEEKVGEIQFGLYDPFVRKIINSCAVSKKEALQGIERQNILKDDIAFTRQMERNGWLIKRYFTGTPIVLGTHCEDQTEFQTFQRWFIAGIKGNGYPLRVVQKLWHQTKLPMYELAMRAWVFGDELKEYPGSHNIEYDKKMYQKFLEQR